MVEIGKGKGAWVVQCFKRPALGFSSLRDLKVIRLSPSLGSTLSGQSM